MSTSLLAEQLSKVNLKENLQEPDSLAAVQEVAVNLPRMTTFPRPVLRKSSPVPEAKADSEKDRQTCVQAFTLDDWGPAAFAKLSARQKDTEVVSATVTAVSVSTVGAIDSPSSSCDSIECASHYSTASGFSGGAESQLVDDEARESSPPDSPTDSPVYSDGVLQANFGDSLRRCRTVSFSDVNVTVTTFPKQEYDRTAVDPCVLSFQERIEFLLWREKMLKEIAEETGSSSADAASSCGKSHSEPKDRGPVSIII